MAGYRDIDSHPLFRGAVSRWTWRFFTQRLTRAGRWFLAPSLLFLGYSGTSLDLQVWAPFCYIGGIWLVAWIAMFLFRPRVSVRTIHGARVCAGETLPVTVEAHYEGRLPGADLFIIPHRLPPGVDAVPEHGAPLPLLKQGEKARVRLGLLCHKRGVYSLRGFRAQTAYPLGLMQAYKLFREERPLLVYPQFRKLTRFQAPMGRRYQPGGILLASTLGDSFEFIGNREYRYGDNIRDIDWRATARLNKPIVREYREEYFLRMAVILDTHVPRRAPQARREDFERAISIGAAVSDYMSRQEYLVDIFAAGPNLYHLMAGRGLAYLDQILDILACVEESPAEAFATLEPALLENLASITTVTCVFLDWTPTHQAFIQRLHAQGTGLKIIVVRDAPCTLTPVAESEPAEIRVIGRSEFESGLDEL